MALNNSNTKSRFCCYRVFFGCGFLLAMLYLPACLLACWVYIVNPDIGNHVNEIRRPVWSLMYVLAVPWITKTFHILMSLCISRIFSHSHSRYYSINNGDQRLVFDLIVPWEYCLFKVKLVLSLSLKKLLLLNRIKGVSKQMVLRKLKVFIDQLALFYLVRIRNMFTSHLSRGNMQDAHSVSKLTTTS